MLGWAFNKATGNASTNAPTPGPDDTYIEQPDTPAPVFAARAFKRAIFGTPAPVTEAAPKQESKPGAPALDKPKSANADSREYESPSKPQGILLTPGTGTSRRKRVSFGRDVKSHATLPDSNGITTRPRTRLQEALENSRKQKNKLSDEDNAKELDFDPEDEAEADWEEVDELDRDPDITVDLNDPRSQSGRYWKMEFQKYHDEARAEMEKLVKYKQLAKSYAKAKDAEALDLNERLREEQAKVLEMEKKITELAGQAGAKQGRGEGTRDDRKLLKDLARETALAAQYRNQVEELEAILKNSGYEADGNRRRRGGTSPQREQRKAREQAKELNDLRQELQRVKSDLSATEQRERKLEVEKRKVSAELAKSAIKVADLERKLTKAEQDRQRKDSQYEKLKADYDALREKTKAQKGDITDIRRGQRASKASDAHLLRDDFENSWANKLEDLQAKLRDEQEARRREMEDASVTINNLRQEYKRASGFKSLDQRLIDLREKRNEKAINLDDDTHDLLQSRALKEKKQTETPLGRSVSRGSKKKAFEPVGSDRPASLKDEIKLSLDRQRNGIPSRETRASTSARRVVDTALSKTSLPADRRAAAMARLEQKRAERRRAHESTVLPGKENIRL